MSKWNNINIADDIHDMYCKERENKRGGNKMPKHIKQQALDNKVYAGLASILIVIFGMAIGNTVVMVLGVALMGIYVIADFTEK